LSQEYCVATIWEIPGLNSQNQKDICRRFGAKVRSATVLYNNVDRQFCVGTLVYAESKEEAAASATTQALLALNDILLVQIEAPVKVEAKEAEAVILAGDEESPLGSVNSFAERFGCSDPPFNPSWS
jgi:hypothetical protein